MFALQSLMPITIMLFVIAMVVVLGIRISRLGKRNDVIRNWVLSLYAIVLVAAFVVSFFLPLQAESDVVSERVFEKEKVPSLYMTSEMDHFKDELQDYTVDEWKMETDAQELNLIVHGEEQDNLNVVVETKKENDGIIEATLYVTPNVIEGIDITTGLIPETSVNLESNGLIVETPRRKQEEISMMKQEFTIRQFTQDDWFAEIKEEFSNDSHFDSGDRIVASEDDPWIDVEDGRMFSTQMLYIRIPSGMTLDPVDLYIDEWRNEREEQN
ncbi:hypothetical protein JNUCC1_02147 [Lentibacillus sp. JNUCC-1]|uniref:hypothetical protein n=1 Tax=Lentibacillus sp. JNUCC-1 TaxID=2654513 RepID=UPI0012E91273|nr:hypothetical protein [Lentibacillus sp. JNUCC-1]MUV38309.1 hypothetical protein [Lentibacillus sp. JNUCC-1]